MLKFFRKIRKGALTENKLSDEARSTDPSGQKVGFSKPSSPLGKYLLYAIGEIILVVIGILLALQINNWNEERKNKLKEHAILLQLEEAYNANLQQLNDKMQLRSKIIHSGLTTLRYIDAPQFVQRDSMIFHLSNIIYDPTFDPIQNDLITSGNIRLIINKKLRQLLSNWTSDIVAVQEQEQINQNHAHEIMLPFFNEIGITRHVLNEVWKNTGNPVFLLDRNIDNLEIELGHSFDKFRVSDVLTNIKLEGVVSSAISYNTLANLQSQALKNRIIEIIDLIKVELKK